jgi:ribosome biogenesis GTPase / thiamine phosphate phosphatase
VTFGGVVARVDLRGVVVLDDGGRLWLAAVRKRLQDPGGRLGNAIVVGDRVTVEAADGALPDDDRDLPVVVGIAPRRNRFERAAAGQGPGGRVQITASNLDQVLAVAALRDPPLREGLLDRIAVATEALGLPLVVALSKADLVPSAEAGAARATYERAGYGVHVLAVPRGEGVESLRAAIEGRRTLVVGHSGVGKSTLLNALAPALALKIGEVNAKTGKGRHTTTAATLARLDTRTPPTEVIDTPGVRTFGLPAIEPAALPRLFPEWRGRGPCRFADCTHRDEPDCAMTRARAEGAIAEDRYRSYLRLREELEAAHAHRTTGKRTHAPATHRKAKR